MNNETPPNILENAKRLRELFFGTKGYWTTLTDPPVYREDGKHKSETKAIMRDLTIDDYVEHLTQDKKQLTVSPLFTETEVYFGSIDIDTYKWDEQKKLNFLDKAIRLDLFPAQTKSGGIHLHTFTSEDEGIKASFMINRLSYCRDELELPVDTEIFPKQSERHKHKLGNGISIPFKGFYKDPTKCKTVGLEITPGGQVKENNIGISLNKWESQTKQILPSRLDQIFYDNWVTYNNPVDHAEKTAKKITQKEIIKNIIAGKEHPKGGTFDNWILMLIAKGVRGMSTDAEILSMCEKVDHKSDKSDIADYFQDKIDNVRKKFGIKDPDNTKEEIKKNLVYIIDEDKYYDIEKGKAYDPLVVDRVFAHIFPKPSCTNWLKTESEKLEVENWLWSPKDYDPNKLIIEVNGLKYLNAYKPNDLKPEEGDTKLWHQLLDYIFMHNKKHKKQFLDWLAYQVQHIGTKLRYAIIVYSKEYQIGKGSIWRAIEKVFGKHNTKEIDVEQALDHAKQYLRNCAIVCIDEMESSGTFSQKKTLLNAMKRIITAGELGHRARYSDYTNVQTQTNYILFTNNKDALSLPKNEKRYSVYMHDKKRLEQGYYDNFHQWLDNEEEAKKNGNHKNFKDGGKYILHELLLRDVKEFNPFKVAPETSFNDLMSEAGAHPLAKLLKEKLDGRYHPVRKPVVSSLGVYNWLKLNNELGRFRINDVAHALESIGGIKREQCKIKMENSDEVKRVNLFIIDDHEWFKNKSNTEVGEYYWSDGGDRDTSNPEEVYPISDERAQEDSFLKDQKPKKTINL
jgi:hypothetical protein|tara:strand:- start:534 stop:2918 length:2385 start_codon:yes stop_codon:yes gene_type:complete